MLSSSPRRALFAFIGCGEPLSTYQDKNFGHLSYGQVHTECGFISNPISRKERGPAVVLQTALIIATVSFYRDLIPSSGAFFHTIFSEEKVTKTANSHYLPFSALLLCNCFNSQQWQLTSGIQLTTAIGFEELMLFIRNP